MILVTGGTGQLGSAFRRLLPAAMAPGRDLIDLSRPAEVAAAVRDLAPSAIINCAAYTVVDAAEDDEATALAVNGTSVGILAAESGRLRITFVTFSTDYVFDGTARAPYTESTTPHPSTPTAAPS